MLYLCEKGQQDECADERRLVRIIPDRESRKYKDVERDHTLREGFFRAVRIMTLVKDVAELRSYSYLHYEQLKHEWSGYSSIRLSNRFVHRLIFMETPEGLEVELIEIDRTHYGNKH